MDKIDFYKILKNSLVEGGLFMKVHHVDSMIVTAMKQSIRQALPIILQMAADNAKTQIKNVSNGVIVDKQSILNSEEEIIKTLGI